MFADLEKICVLSRITIRQAVQVLNDGHQRIALVVDDKQRLLGVVADADIRRSILNGLSFDRPVSEIMAIEPIVAFYGMSDSAILSLMQSTKCYEIPVLDAQRKVVDLKTIDMLVDDEHSTEAVIMAGGLGTRLMPLTENLPKPLITVGDKPILFLLLDQLIAAGFNQIYICLNYKADMIRQSVLAVPSYARLIHFVEEKERLGTAGALSLLQKSPSAPFFVLNADLLTKIDLKAMLRFHKMEGNDVTMAVREEKYQVPFGVVKLQGGQVLGIEEKPVQTYFSNAGIYVVAPSILNLVPSNKIYDMPDLINDAVTDRKQVGIFPVHEYWLDIGRHSDLKRANDDVRSS